VFSPYTVEKMRCGRDELLILSDNSPKDKVTLNYGGGQVSRQSVEKGAKRYSLAVNRYLIQKAMERISDAASQHTKWSSVMESLRPMTTLQRALEWTDVAGLLAPREVLTELESRVANGSIASYDALVMEFQKIHHAYLAYEWQYVYETYTKEFGVELTNSSKDQIVSAANNWESSASSLHEMILEDSKKEFGDFARIGYGLDQLEGIKQKDFEAVRGTIDTNIVVQKLAAEGSAIKQKNEQFKMLVASIPV
jgi:hypothetical protein